MKNLLSVFIAGAALAAIYFALRDMIGTVTAFGATRHADPDKFYLSVATWDPVRNKWYYPGLTGVGGGVGVQYIVIGQNPDYGPPTPAP